MSRPQRIEWLEDETGERLERQRPLRGSRARVDPGTEELFRRLRSSPRRDETVSQTARRMLLDGLAAPSSTEEAIDAAIASLLEARDRLGHV